MKKPAFRRPRALRLRKGAIALLAAAATWPALAARPNILFILSDDQRADAIHALGNESIQTPNLDRLVQEGTVFERAYCMGGLTGAVCMPSRAMILSSLSLFRVRHDLKGQATWPELLRRAGYQTFATGKWHNGAESLARSFESAKAVFLGGMCNHLQVPVRDLEAGKLGPKRIGKKFSSELFADAAVEFLRRRDRSRPFCLYVAFTAPHDPRMPPRRFLEPYRKNPPPIPVNFMPAHPFDNGELTIRDEQLAPWPRTPEVVQEHLAAYYGMIAHMDAQIGRILDALEETGAGADTLIVFTSDQGLAVGSHGLMGKQNLYEHSMRVPLIFAGLDVPKNVRRKALCYLLDLGPTVCGFAGVKPPAPIDGIDLRPAIRSPERAARSEVLLAYRSFQRAVCGPRWKLIRYPQINKTQLFDLETDPYELKNLDGGGRFDDLEAELLGRLKALQKQFGDALPLTSPHPKSPVPHFPNGGKKAGS